MGFRPLRPVGTGPGSGSAPRYGSNNVEIWVQGLSGSSVFSSGFRFVDSSGAGGIVLGMAAALATVTHDNRSAAPTREANCRRTRNIIERPGGEQSVDCS